MKRCLNLRKGGVNNLRSFRMFNVKKQQGLVIKRLNFIIYKSIFYLAYVHSLPQTYNYLHLYKPSPHFSNVLMLSCPFRITKPFIIITSNNTTSTHAAVLSPLFIIPSSLSPSHPLDIGVGVIPNERRTKVKGVEV